MGAPDYPPRFDEDLVRPFYDGLAAGELRLPHCARCGTVHWYPPEVLPCHPDAAPEWRTVSGEGVVYSFTTIVRSLLPGDDNTTTPYEVVLVEPDAAPGSRIVALLCDGDGRSPACGLRVQLSPVRAGDHFLPGFRPLP
ncbi:MAG: OB-fold domain-containing protein [Caulobacterales bacterium]|nr:OB-fold domain-containing protein [Caulobacterales bacterium]